jgi:hypothetical protein
MSKKAVVSVPRKLLLSEEGAKNEVKLSFHSNFRDAASDGFTVKRGKPDS